MSVIKYFVLFTNKYGVVKLKEISECVGVSSSVLECIGSDSDNISPSGVPSVPKVPVCAYNLAVILLAGVPSFDK